MTYQTRNIIVGAAHLYVSEEGQEPALPANPTSTTASFTTVLDAAASGYSHAGFTSEGLEISYEPDYGEVEVDQLLDSARLFKQSMRVSLNTTMVEATLKNLMIVWAQPSTSVISSTAQDGPTEIGIAGGALGDAPVERSLVAVGPGPRTPTNGTKERIYHARRVLSVESTSHALRRNEATMFPVSFRLLPDPNPSFANAEYGIIRDRVLA